MSTKVSQYMYKLNEFEKNKNQTLIIHDIC